jgi:hypothetical protein
LQEGLVVVDDEDASVVHGSLLVGVAGTRPNSSTIRSRHLDVGDDRVVVPGKKSLLTMGAE